MNLSDNKNTICFSQPLKAAAIRLQPLLPDQSLCCSGSSIFSGLAPATSPLPSAGGSLPSNLCCAASDNLIFSLLASQRLTRGPEVRPAVLGLFYAQYLAAPGVWTVSADKQRNTNTCRPPGNTNTFRCTLCGSELWIFTGWMSLLNSGSPMWKTNQPTLLVPDRTRLVLCFTKSSVITTAFVSGCVPWLSWKHSAVSTTKNPTASLQEMNLTKNSWWRQIERHFDPMHLFI